MKLFNLEGRVAVVTGGNGGIGLGMAKGMASIGASIVVAGRNADKAADAVKQLQAMGAEATFIPVDVSEDKSCADLIAASAAQFGRLDILINNAGINNRKQPDEYKMSEWREVLDVNLNSAFACCQAAYPEMQKAGGGKIINIGSMYSLFGGAYTVPYAASKGGIVQMTKGLAAAWAKDNIQVNAVLPGWIDTELTQNARRVVDGLHDNVLRRTPAGRWGDIDDMAGIAAFLASPGSDFVTGTAIPVDGGYAVLG
jgi:2-deoxy-D-gluconate 3-dehydrogenase